MNIGIIGYGYVGQATSLLGSNKTQLMIFDKDPDRSDWGTSIEDLIEFCEFIFVCVPTPMNHDGSCSTLEVSKVVYELIDKKYAPERIVVRSTVPVGTCRKLGTMFMPEFLTEKNYEEDVRNQDHWILGTNDRNDDLREKLFNILTSAHEIGSLKKVPQLKFTTTEEAELSKYVRNCFLSTKVSFFNEIYKFCEAKGINYDNVREISALDPRINESHTQVPGPDGKFGFGGTCFPKDMNSLSHQLNRAGVKALVMQSCLKRNDSIDRPEKDWKNDKGRAVL